MSIIRCPTCKKPIDPKLATAPFCSERCRQVDLGRWLGENYSLPVYRLDEDEEEAGEGPPNES